MQTLAATIDLDKHPLGDPAYGAQCRDTLDHHGVLVLRRFLRANAIAAFARRAKPTRTAPSSRPAGTTST